MRPRGSPWRTYWLAAGLAFLYVPIALLMAYSFNDSRLVTVWTGFSVRWYGELLENERILESAWLSLMIAAASATIALTLGTLAALAMTRAGRFPSRIIFASMLAAPLVMPEVITGLSLLLLFVSLDQAIGWPGERGFITIVIAHATFGMAYVAVIVQARLATLDRSIEEAALDLGARPRTVLLAVTLPMIAPSLAAAWLLAFTLSLDDLVIASFVTGPGATTLPMIIYSSVRLGLSPQVNALATILVLVVFCLIVAAGLLLRRDAVAGSSA